MNFYLYLWLYVIIMSRTRFRVNLHSIVTWMSRNLASLTSLVKWLSIRWRTKLFLFNNYVTHRGWVDLSVFVMLRNGKQGSEWYWVKGSSVTVKKKKNLKAFFFVLLWRDRGFINAHSIFAIILYLSNLNWK